jgi:cytochrome c-type biogenesis protein CcmF
MTVAHLGVAVAIAGAAANAAFTVEKLAVVRPGERISVGPWLVQFEAVQPVAGENWTGIEGQIAASRGGGEIRLAPRTHYYWAPPAETNEAAIETFWNGQLYTVIGKADDAGGWQLRLWWKPFVTLIWAGGLLIALGGALALVGRLQLRWRRRRTSEWRRS